MEENLSTYTQECLLYLLCYDSKYGPIVRNSYPLDGWDTYYRPIADLSGKFWDSYQKPPQEHLIDLVEDLVKQKPDRGEVYNRILQSLDELKDQVNGQFILDRMHRHLRGQRLRQVIQLVYQDLDQGKTEEVEGKLLDVLRTGYPETDLGVNLSDTDKSLQFLQWIQQSIPIGIPELDRFHLGPTPKELLLFIAPPKKGKSWFLVHVGKQSILQRQNVVHITLEMSEELVCRRYIQSLLSYSKNHSQVHSSRIIKDEFGSVSDFEEITYERPTLCGEGVRSKLEVDISNIRRVCQRLRIKEFPTGGVTLRQVEAYLDQLEVVKKVVPNVLIVDYVDLLKIDPSNYRISLGNLVKDLRGLGVRRNLAIVTATQSNREGLQAGVITGSHVSEDFSKIATADCVMTYNQSSSERHFGVARIHVAASRNDSDQFTVLISQNYETGQFCLSSARMSENYWKIIGEKDDQSEVD